MESWFTVILVNMDINILKQMIQMDEICCECKTSKSNTSENSHVQTFHFDNIKLTLFGWTFWPFFFLCLFVDFLIRPSHDTPPQTPTTRAHIPCLHGDDLSVLTRMWRMTLRVNITQDL